MGNYQTKRYTDVLHMYPRNLKCELLFLKHLESRGSQVIIMMTIIITIPIDSPAFVLSMWGI